MKSLTKELWINVPSGGGLLLFAGKWSSLFGKAAGGDCAGVRRRPGVPHAAAPRNGIGRDRKGDDPRAERLPDGGEVEQPEIKCLKELARNGCWSPR